MTSSPTVPTPEMTPPPPPPAPGSPVGLLPDPPRPVTTRAARRAWADPGVRFWWVAGVGLLLAAGYMTFAGYRAWSHQAWLARHGTVVQAKVVQANQLVWEGRGAPPDADVVLAFDWAGRPHRTTGRLANRRPGEFIFVGRLEPIRVNPADPNDWTAFTGPPPAGGFFLGTIVATPPAALALLAAWLARRGVLRTYRDGRVVPARVVGRQQTALAPNSAAVRCAPVADDGTPGRVVTVYVPKRPAGDAGDAGDEVLVLCRPTGGGRPLAADWFA